MHRTVAWPAALALALACLTGRAHGQADKVYSVGKDGLKIEGTVEATDKKVEIEVKDKRGSLPAKLYPVKLTGGVKYRILMSSDALDAFLVLQDAAGKQLAFDDDSGGGSKGLDAQIDFTAPKDGTYKIYAAALQGTGKFILTVRPTGGDKKEKEGAGKVQEVGKDGLRITGKLGEGVKERVYQVKLVEGKTYVIDMISADQKSLDPYLRLLDATGKKLEEDDDGGEGLNARITFRATATGTYQIVATSFGGRGLGEFTLEVRAKE
jgi:serine protease Do